MQLPYSWIRELVDISWSPEELAERLTLGGAEAELQQMFENDFENIVIGKIIELKSIAGSDHLKEALVDSGEGEVTVVCGAPNCEKGQKVVLAKIGAVLKNGMEIKKVKLRGVESCGMICSEAELGLSDDHSGIIVLEDDAGIGKSAREGLGLDDYIIKLDLTPNRPDLLSAIGVAREVACLAGNKIRRPSFKIGESDEKASDYVKVSIDDPEACPRYAARVIRGIKISPSPWWIKRKLILCGIRPISNIVDITNLVMMEYGHPLHAFDYDRFGRKEILVRRAVEDEEFTTLDGQEHSLNPEVLLITDGEKAVAAAGVMGGLDPEISANTSDILLESAYFNPVTIRRGRLKLGIISESSTRFEKGADPNIIPAAIDRAAYLMKEYGGGNILSGIVDCYPRKIAPVEIELRPGKANSFLGTGIPGKRMIEILRGLEFEVREEGNLKVKVPTFQPDVTREVDLIEEIARIEGYDSIPSKERNLGPLYTPVQDDDLLRSEIRRALTAQGYDETYGSGLADAGLLSRVSGDKRVLRILNPIADDLTVMQNSLLYSLLKSVGHNIAHRNMNLQLFEIGKVFRPGNPPDEEEQIGIILSGRTDDSWHSKGKDFSIYDLKGAIDSLFDTCRLPPVELLESDTTTYKKDFSFNVGTNGESIGQAGQIEAEVARIFGIKQSVFAAVLDFGNLLKLRQSKLSFTPLPRFPAAPRDLAVIVDESVKAGDLLRAIRKMGGKLVEDVEIFDLYRGKQIGEGKKSLAFTFTYRSPERSLSSEEVADIHGKIAEYLKQNFNAVVREG
jgi:phenylalanyl-tRNA synthetase beta chain